MPLGRCVDRSQAEHITEMLGEVESAFLESYDYVLMDTDFIGSPFFSAPAVSSSDGVVLVIRAGKTNRQIAGRACDIVRRIGGKILGVVLNRREFPIPEFIYRRL
jgi:Mrp family chromosome partitioning ATPase